jgi:hypothetical protein
MIRIVKPLRLFKLVRIIKVIKTVAIADTIAERFRIPPRMLRLMKVSFFPFSSSAPLSLNFPSCPHHAFSTSGFFWLAACLLS